LGFTFCWAFGVERLTGTRHEAQVLVLQMLRQGYGLRVHKCSTRRHLAPPSRQSPPAPRPVVSWDGGGNTGASAARGSQAGGGAGRLRHSP
jgi:hypothetical protein